MFKKLLTIMVSAAMLMSVSLTAFADDSDNKVTYNKTFANGNGGNAYLANWQQASDGTQYIYTRHPRIGRNNFTVTNYTSDGNGGWKSGNPTALVFWNSWDGSKTGTYNGAHTPEYLGTKYVDDYTITWTDDNTKHSVTVGSNDTVESNNLYDYSDYDGHPAVIFCAKPSDGIFRNITDMSFVYYWKAVDSYHKSCEHTDTWTQIGSSYINIEISDDLKNWETLVKDDGKLTAATIGSDEQWYVKDSHYAYRISLSDINKKYVKIELPYGDVDATTTGSVYALISGLSLTYDNTVSDAPASLTVLDEELTSQGNDYTYSVTVQSNADDEQEVTMIFAAYKDDRLIGIASSESAALSKDDMYPLQATATFTETPDKVKAYYWNNLQSLIPIIDAQPVDWNSLIQE